MSVSSAVQSVFKQKFSNRVLFDEPLAPYLAYRVGGPADILVFPVDEPELSWISERAGELSLPMTIIGQGTNLLVLDGGIRGVVISLLKAFREIRLLRSSNANTIRVSCGGGVQKAELLNWAAERGYSGLEFSAGVPGTIGGGIFMNAGTKYGCYGDILRRLRLFDFEHGLREFLRHEVHFGYREQNAVKNSIVTEVEFELAIGKPTVIKSEIARIIAEREEKQPLDYPSCGSTFKNPPTGLSAGRLIERAGLKGTSVGGAEISLKHANFILNKGQAKASDITALISLAKTRVKELFGVELECEVIILGSPESGR